MNGNFWFLISDSHLLVKDLWFGFLIQDFWFGFLIPISDSDFWFWFLIGFLFPDFWFWIRNLETEIRIRNQETEIGIRNQETEIRKQKSGSRNQETEIWIRNPEAEICLNSVKQWHTCTALRTWSMAVLMAGLALHWFGSSPLLLQSISRTAAASVGPVVGSHRRSS